MKICFLLLESKTRGGISSVIGDRYVKSVEKMIYFDAIILFGHSVSQPLPFDELEFEKKFCLKEILNTADDNEIEFSWNLI